MQFHLNYSPQRSPKEISHGQKILLTGSCFAENIGEYLNRYKFKSLINPSGILFNPVSISQSLHSIIDNSELQSELLTEGDAGFYSMLHHGDFRSESRHGLLNLVHSATSHAHKFVTEAGWLIVSFGSAYVYRFLKTGHIVANCHKLPQNLFKKELLSSQEIVSAYKHLIEKLRVANPDLNIIFTVSPVKYLRDGVVENNLSKSILIQSVHEIVNAHSNCFYFPAYELIVDDLRDYRFYKSDLAHPNDAAIKYVWEKFSESFFSEETKMLNKRLEELILAAGHRPINPESETHIKFLKNYFSKCEVLEKEFPFLDLSNEKDRFKLP